MLKVNEILRVKGHTLYTGTPDMPVRARWSSWTTASSPAC